MKTVERPFIREKITNVHSVEKVLTAAVKLNSALSSFLDAYTYICKARAIRLNRMDQKNRNMVYVRRIVKEKINIFTVQIFRMFE